jgi:hypothetical protein
MAKVDCAPQVRRGIDVYADVRHVTGLARRLVLAVPVPEAALLEQPAAVGVDVDAGRVRPDAAV